MLYQFIAMYISVSGTLTAINDKVKLNSLKILFNL